MNYINVINRPASECNGNAVYIGPTAFDFTMIPAPLIPAGEAASLKRWAKQDLARFYHEQRSNYYR